MESGELFKLPWREFNRELDKLSEDEKDCALAYAHGYMKKSRGRSE